MPVRVGCISLGCPKNLVDSEIMLGILQKGDFEITTDLMKAEAIIVNTCAFIGDAKEEAVDAILEAALLKKTGNLKALVVTGCLAQRYKENIINEIPEVDVVVGTGNIPEIRKAIETKLSGDKENVLYTDEPDGTGYLDNRRELSEDGASKYLKIAEGCSNFCTYCIIPALRGPFRSRTIESILTEAEFLVKKGAKELIIIAQDVSRYGEDNYGESKLVDLIRKLSEIEDLKWIRLLYCYPERITKELITELKTNPKLVKYLDIPIQHASDSILKAMGRKSRREDLIALMTMLRKEISDIILRTTLISGFPGETEEDFEHTLDVVRKVRFDQAFTFLYSKRTGTKAAKLETQVPDHVKKERFQRLLDVQNLISEEINQSWVEPENLSW
jgi:ribosomal protein S12 methylthiotransferase